MGTTVLAKGARLLVPGIICFLTSAPVFAETQKLALPQVIEVSLQNNGDLKSFREEKGIRDAGKIRAGLLPNPTLDFEAGTGALTGSSAENSLSLGVSQEFFLAGKREKRLTIAEQELEMYRWQLADRERALRDEVKTAFYDVILAEQRIVLTDRAIALNRQLLDVTKERLAAGDIPELEMNLVKVELARGEGAKIDVERALNQNQAKLGTLMGLSVGEYPAIVGSLESATSMTKNLPELKQLAHGKRPDLKALEAEKNRGESDIILAQAESIPNLTAGFAIKRDTTAIEVGSAEYKDTDYIIGLKLSMPIPLFDKNQAGVQEARAKRSSTESRLTAVTRNVERDVETAYTSVLNAEKVLSLYKSNIIPQLEENLKLTQEAYRLGEVGILSVIQEQKKFFEVSEGYLTALHARQLALVKLESAVATDINGGVQ
ncbi:TolC family protein [Geobacter pelophilus]|uniref:TolC family protein n=1 Tax=Geoanaerobacter pelophilus TaxID=60036 RepID=A0AAW4KWV5_9BACT|nr:TolC family protein [Geoanaerobacter pelophilus]MBT0663093.1 TolC family protein [Geoanaerobacter pelophilus]